MPSYETIRGWLGGLPWVKNHKTTSKVILGSTLIIGLLHGGWVGLDALLGTLGQRHIGPIVKDHPPSAMAVAIVGIVVGTVYFAMSFVPWPSLSAEAGENAHAPPTQRTGWELHGHEVPPVTCEGISWRWSGLRATTGPYIESVCDKHGAPYRFKNSLTGEYDEPEGDFWISRDQDGRWQNGTYGTLYCAGDGGHEDTFDSDPRNYGQARFVAMPLMEAEILRTTVKE